MGGGERSWVGREGGKRIRRKRYLEQINPSITPTHGFQNSK